MKKKRKTLCILIVAILVSAGIFGNITKSGFENADIIFVDVGQGDCIHLRTSGGKNFLIDGGGNINYNVGKKTLKPYLLKNGVKSIDGAIVTHLHTDHYKGIAELCREGMVKKLFIYEGNKINEETIVKDTGLSRENIVYIYEGNSLTLGENSRLNILWPERKLESEYEKLTEDDENEISLIIEIEHEGIKALATGDIDEEYHDKLAEIYKTRLRTDILKVAHHGSKYSYSNNFTHFANPRFAVIQVGKNNYGHPNEDVIASYEGEGTCVLRNDLAGAVGFMVDEGGNLKYITVK